MRKNCFTNNNNTIYKNVFKRYSLPLTLIYIQEKINQRKCNEKEGNFYDFIFLRCFEIVLYF